MTTYELDLPEPPPIGSSVIDNKNREWVRTESSWWFLMNTHLHIVRSWKSLLQRGPLTLKEPEPSQGDIRTHKSTNTLFVVYMGSEWVCYQLFSNGTSARVPTFDLNQYRSNEQIEAELNKGKIKA